MLTYQQRIQIAAIRFDDQMNKKQKTEAIEKIKKGEYNYD